MDISNYNTPTTNRGVISGRPAGDEEKSENRACGAGDEQTRPNRGLSTAHNSTLPSAQFWAGGTVAKVQRYNEAQTGDDKKRGDRGRIKEFSRQSRRRLMVKLAKIDKSVQPVFVTLTLPDEFESDNPATGGKKMLKRFEQRFKRKFPDGAYVWRLELMPRKSGRFVGKLYPHFHLLVYNVEFVQLYMWVNDAWWECCGRLSEAHRRAGTRVETLRSHKGVVRYASKYMAKTQDYNLFIGRVWGVVGVEHIPFVQAVLCLLTEKEAITLIRYMRRFAHLRSRDYKSLTIFLDAGMWYKVLPGLLYPL